MRTGRPTKPLILTPEEEAKLELMARRPKTDQRTALRARIVLDCATGLSNTKVAAQRRVTIQTVGKWRQRFVDGRLGALGDAPRSGQPRKLTGDKIEAVITRTLETKPKNATHWSTRTMAQASGLNQNAIVRIWRALGLKPHLQENFKLSTDAFFIDRTVPAALDVHLVLDNYATHKTSKVAAWFQKRPRYHLHFTPTSASWLNQVERWFAKITEQRIRRGVFKHVDELITAIDDYIVGNNQNPKPFVWTASAKLILDRVGRLCKRSTRSPH